MSGTETEYTVRMPLHLTSGAGAALARITARQECDPAEAVNRALMHYAKHLDDDGLGQDEVPRNPVTDAEIAELPVLDMGAFHRVAAEFGVRPDQVTLRGCGHRCERCEQQPEDCACGVGR